MTAYLANHQKKQRIFAKREQELQHAIKHVADEDKLLFLAEQVRAAKMSVFKCKLTQNSTTQPNTVTPELIAEKVSGAREWIEMTAREIVELYRKVVG